MTSKKYPMGASRRREYGTTEDDENHGVQPYPDQCRRGRDTACNRCCSVLGPAPGGRVSLEMAGRHSFPGDASIQRLIEPLATRDCPFHKRPRPSDRLRKTHWVIGLVLRLIRHLLGTSRCEDDAEYETSPGASRTASLSLSGSTSETSYASTLSRNRRVSLRSNLGSRASMHRKKRLRVPTQNVGH